LTDSVRVLVVGGTGGVGEGIVRALVAQREHISGIAVSSRDAEKLARLHRSIDLDPLVTTVVGDVGTMNSARELRDAVRALGRIDVVIASIGGWWAGPELTQIDDETWSRTLGTMFTTHAICARTFVRELEHDGGKYLAIGGGAALAPVPGSSLVSIAGAAQMMLTRSLVAERGPDRAPLIRELVVDGPVSTTAPHHGPQTEGETTAQEVGEAVAGWVVRASLHERSDAFDWPSELLETNGPITIMRCKKS
jgi:NAD(P)-dependent dehydrogenase (short-subunit alcohol dehydrogenase family)